MVKESALVSIIIPTYNRAHLLGETLDSIIAQTYKNWECIVVDDESDDDTQVLLNDYIKRDRRFSFYRRPEVLPKGANACRNYGFEKSQGDYINWFDSDDIMHANKLMSQVMDLEKSELPFTVCQSLVFEGRRDNIIGLRCKQIYSDNFFGDFITNKIKWLTQAPLVKRSFLTKNNLKFDETLAQSQERDFYIRVLDIVDDYHYDDTPLVYLRKHQDSISYGNFSEDKLKSNFKVNFMTLENFNSKLKVSEKAVLIKGIKQVMKQSIHCKYFNLTKDISKRMTSHFTTYEKVKMPIAVFLLKNFKKGDVFFK